MTAAEHKPPMQVRPHALIALRRVAAAGQLAQAMLRVQAALARAEHKSSARTWLALQAAGRDIGASVDQHSRAVFLAGLYAAVDCRDSEFRARVLADVAAQLDQLGLGPDCLELISPAAADLRTSDRVRRELAEIRARVVDIGSYVDEGRS